MVSDIINKISEMLLAGYQYKHLQPTISEEITFIEDNPNTKNPEVKYTASNHLLALKFDSDINEKNKKGKNIKIANGDMFLFFEDIEGLKKMCDYVVFYKFDRKNTAPTAKQEYLFCFLINLKSDVSGTSHKQLEAAEIFASFIFAQAKRLSKLQTELTFIKTLHKTPSSTLNKTGQKRNRNVSYDFSKVLEINRKEDFDNLCASYYRQYPIL